MGKRAVAQVELTSEALPRRVKRKLRKDTVTRGDFYEAARTLESNVVIGISQGELGEACCLIQVDNPIGNPSLTVAYLSDPQVRELIQVLKDYLSAKED